MQLDSPTIGALARELNDTLAGGRIDRVLMPRSDLLILLSDINGLYTKDPHRFDDAELIEEVRAITPEILALAGDAGSDLGTGGMATKLSAAKIIMEAGENMVIANGAEPQILYDIIAGRKTGTRFIGKGGT